MVELPPVYHIPDYNETMEVPIISVIELVSLSGGSALKGNPCCISLWCSPNVGLEDDGLPGFCENGSLCLPSKKSHIQ